MKRVAGAALLLVAACNASAPATTTTTATTTTSDVSSSSASIAASSSGGCASPSIEVNGDGAPKSLDAGCGALGSDTAAAWEEQPDGGDVTLHLAACASGASTSLEITASGPLRTGDIAPGDARYIDAAGTTWSAFPTTLKLTIDATGAVGEAVRGQFAVTVNAKGPSRAIEGTFTLCRAPDR